MSKQTIEPGGRKASKPAKTTKRTVGNGAAGRVDNGRGAGSKKAQLVAFLSRKGGARLSVISERLGWQAHTVHAAISGLRKQGYDITTSTAPHSKKPTGNGETVHAIVAPSGAKDAATDGASR